MKFKEAKWVVSQTIKYTPIQKEKEALSYFFSLAEKLDVERLSQVTADLVEKNFPKGECKERGQAIVLHAQMLIKIVDYLKGPGG